MFDLVRNRAGLASSFLPLTLGFVLLFSLTACNKKENPESAQAAPKTFASPDDAGKALRRCREIAKSGCNSGDLRSGIGSDSFPLAMPPKTKLRWMDSPRHYQVMNRWRKLGDGSELLLVGAENQAFPIPLMKNAAGQWYFDAAAGKEEILARRIGRDELAAIDVCAALADSQDSVLFAKARWRQTVRAKIHQRSRPAERIVLGVSAGLSSQPARAAGGVRDRRGIHRQA